MAPRSLTRRSLLGAAAGAGALAAAAGGARLAGADGGARRPARSPHRHAASAHAAARGERRPGDQRVRPPRDPHRLRRRPGDPPPRRARCCARWTIVAQDREIEIAPGVRSRPGPTTAGCPGPTLRATRAICCASTSSTAAHHPHTMHFHGIHTGRDGRRAGLGPGGLIAPGEEFTYEFDAEPVRAAPLPLPRRAPGRAHRTRGCTARSSSTRRPGRPARPHEMVHGA